MTLSKFAPAIISVVVLSGCFEKSADEHFKTAQQNFSDQKHDIAIIELKNAISKAPQNAKYRYTLGQAYFAQGAFLQAEKEFTKAIELGFDKVKADNFLVQINYYNYSFAYIIKCHEETPSFISHYYTALVDLQENKIELAQHKLTQLADSDTQWGELAKSHLLSLNNNYEEGLMLVNKILNEHPTLLAALVLKPQMLLLSGETTEATNAVEALVKQYPQHLPFTIQLASAYLNINQLDQAEKLTSNLIKQYKTHPYINFLHSQVSMVKQDFVQAKELAEYAIQNRVDNSASRLIAGLSNYQLGKYEQAYEHLQPLEGKLPADHFANKLLVDLQLRLGYEQEALNTLDILTTNNQANSQLLSTASHFMLRSGNKKAAESLLASSMNVSKNNSEELTRHGILMLQMNKLEQATAALEKALTLTPELEVAEQSLASAYLAQNQFDKAQEIATLWQNSDDLDQRAKGWLFQSAVHNKAKQTDLAEQALAKVLEIDENNISALFQLGVIAHRKGNYKLAYENYIQVLQQDNQHQGALQALLTISTQPNYQQKVSQWLQEQYDKDNSNTLIAVHYAYANALDKNYDKSVSILEKTRRLHNNATETLALIDAVLADIYLASKNIEKAIYYYKASLANKASFKTEKKLLNAYELSGNYQQALNVIQDKLAETPDNTTLQLLKVYYQSVIGTITDDKTLENLHKVDNIQSNWLYHKALGNIAARKKHFTQANEYYSKALELFPTESNMLAWSKTASATKQYELVIKKLESSEWLKTSQPINLVLADAYLATEQHQLAYDTYLYVSENFKDNFLVLNNLAYLALKKGQTSKALEVAQKAYKLAPENPGVLDTLARALSENGKKMQALEYFDKAIKLAPASNEIKINKAQTLVDLKFRSEAHELLTGLKGLTEQQQEKVNQLLN